MITDKLTMTENELFRVAAERDKYKAERDGLVTLCEKILKIMERDNDQFRSDTRGWAYGHLFAAINKIKEG